MRVLFVDPEERVLDALRRMLATMNVRWGAEFATTEEAAFEKMDQEPVDVVVCELLSLKADNHRLQAQQKANDFFERISERYPSTVRVILTGHTDQARLLKSITSAHLFLQKPCDARELERIISSALCIKSTLKNPELQKLILDVGALPMAPRLYSELVTELSKEHPSVRRAAEIVSKDPGVAAKLLQLVNSAYFGFVGKVASLEKAVEVLGFATLRAVVLTLETRTMLDSGKVDWFDVEREARHGAAVGKYAALIAKHLDDRCDLADAALTAGLLHDIGKIVLATRLTERYEAVIHRAAGHSSTFTTSSGETCSKATCRRAASFEKKPIRLDGLAGKTLKEELVEFGVSHAEVGGYLLALWGLPKEIVDAISWHHVFFETDSNRDLVFDEPGIRLAAIVALADHFVHENSGQGTAEYTCRPHVQQKATIMDSSPTNQSSYSTRHFGRYETTSVVGLDPATSAAAKACEVLGVDLSSLRDDYSSG